MKKFSHKIRLVCILLLAAGLCFGAPVTADASAVTFGLDVEFSGATAPGGSMPWLTATFDDDDSAGSLQLSLNADNLIESEFVSKWYFNFDTEAFDIDSLSISYASGSPQATDISKGINAFRAGGDGYFDILFEFPTSNSEDRFGQSESVVYDIELTGITAYSFNFGSEPEQGSSLSLFSAAHVQGIGPDGEDSGWIGDPVPTPIPGAVWLLGSGLVGIIFLRRKRSVK
jgi:hypothetical protein